MYTYTSYQNAFTDYSLNTSTGNQARGVNLINESIKYIVEKYYLNESQYQTLTVAGQQQYQMPFNIKDVINETIMVGVILWQPLEAPSRQFWDSLNTIPFTSDFPQFGYRFTQYVLNLFPIPATSGNILTINYKRRLRALSAADYTTGTVTVVQRKLGTLTAIANSPTMTGTVLSGTKLLANNDAVILTGTGSVPAGFTAGTTYYVVNQSGTNPASFTFQLSATMSGSAITPITAGSGTISYYQNGSTVTGSGTAWTTNMEGRWLNIPFTSSNTTSGDNEWYQIKTVNSATSLTLFNDYQGPSITSASSGYTIGEVSLIPEDYQDLALWRALWIYHSTIAPDKAKAAGYQELYTQGKEILDEEFGSKSTNPVLTPPNAPVFNPNLFPRITS